MFDRKYLIYRDFLDFCHTCTLKKYSNLPGSEAFQFRVHHWMSENGVVKLLVRLSEHDFPLKCDYEESCLSDQKLQ